LYALLFAIIFAHIDFNFWEASFCASVMMRFLGTTIGFPHMFTASFFSVAEKVGAVLDLNELGF